MTTLGPLTWNDTTPSSSRTYLFLPFFISFSLQREVTEIRESVKVLHDKLRNAEAALARLVKTRSTLENDINVKENSLQIDSKLCMGMRKSFPMAPNIGPIFQMPLDI